MTLTYMTEIGDDVLYKLDTGSERRDLVFASHSAAENFSKVECVKFIGPADRVDIPHWVDSIGQL